jgi:hypothetical protein
MNNDQIQQEISIIKNMIERTKKDTAASGSIFLFIGLVGITFIIVVLTMEKMRLYEWVLPAMISMTILSGIIGFFVVRKSEKEEKISTYAKKVNLVILTVCSLTMILTSVVFPATYVYPWQLSPIFVALLVGIMLITSGAIFDFHFFYWAGLVSFAGSIIMAYTLQSPYPIRGITLIFILITGFVIPGFLFNKKFKNRSGTNES